MHYNDILRSYFDGLLGDGTGAGEDKDYRPFYAINYNDEKQLTKHLTDTLALLQDEASARTENQLRNIMFYQGIHALQDGGTSIRAEGYDNSPVSMENRFVMNHILEFTLSKQAKVMAYDSNVNVYPWTNDYEAKLGARLGKRVLNNAFYVHDIEDKLSDFTLEAFVCGESYMFPRWDKYAGAKKKDVAIAEQRKDKFGLTFTNDKGEDILLHEIPRIGDHTYEQPLPWLVLHEPKVRWADVNYLYKGTVKHIDEIRAENRGRKIDVDSKSVDPSVHNHPGSEYGEWVIEWEFFHKHTRFVPKGIHAKFFNSTLLSVNGLEEKHGNIPVVRFTDYDQIGNAHGVSFYESLKLPSVMINNMTKVAYRSFCISAYPKIIGPRNSYNMYALANGPFIIDYTPGVTPPALVSFNAVNKDFFPLAEHVEAFMEKNSGTFGFSRGNDVPNARATSILNFYEEQEQKRGSRQISKYTASIEKLARYTLYDAADHYKPEDNRTIGIIGKTNAYKTEKITNTKLLANPNVVQIERTTALSESKQARVDQISTLSSIPLAGEDGAGLFTREQLLSLMELGDTTTFFERSTNAVDRAESENEDMFEGKPVTAPAEYQAHLIDWYIHFQFMQSSEFYDTEGLPRQVVTAFENHLRTHEMWLYKAALRNVRLAEHLVSNKYFPCIYVPSPGTPPLSQVVIMLNTPPLPPPPPIVDGEGALPPIPPSLGDVPDEVSPDVLSDEPLPQADELPLEELQAAAGPAPTKTVGKVTPNPDGSKSYEFMDVPV